MKAMDKPPSAGNGIAAESGVGGKDAEAFAGLRGMVLGGHLLRSVAAWQSRQNRLEAHRLQRPGLLGSALRLLRRACGGEGMSTTPHPQKHYPLTDRWISSSWAAERPAACWRASFRKTASAVVVAGTGAVARSSQGFGHTTNFSTGAHSELTNESAEAAADVSQDAAGQSGEAAQHHVWPAGRRWHGAFHRELLALPRN